MGEFQERRSGHRVARQSSLGRVRGLGSTREGVLHWWSQRLSAVALLPLSLWFMYSAIANAGADYYAFRAWVSEFGNTVFLMLFIITLFHHASLGLAVVIEDYIHDEAWKMGLLMVIKYGSILLGMSSLVAVLKISLGA